MKEFTIRVRRRPAGWFFTDVTVRAGDKAQALDAVDALVPHFPGALWAATGDGADESYDVEVLEVRGVSAGA